MKKLLPFLLCGTPFVLAAFVSQSTFATPKPTVTPKPRPTVKPKPKPTATPTPSPADYQRQYLTKALKLANETSVIHSRVAVDTQLWRMGSEIWDNVLKNRALGGEDLPGSEKYNPEGDDMQKRRKDILNNLVILEKLGELLSSITPVPSSYAEMDENFAKYSQRLPSATQLIRSGVELPSTMQTKAGENELETARRYFVEGYNTLDRRSNDFLNKKTYVPG